MLLVNFFTFCLFLIIRNSVWGMGISVDWNSLPLFYFFNMRQLALAQMTFSSIII